MTRKCTEPEKMLRLRQRAMKSSVQGGKVNWERAFTAFLSTGTKGHEMKLAEANFIAVT